MKERRGILILVSTWLFVAHAQGGSIPGVSGSWPQWRGPDRSNRSLDTALLKEWPTNGPPLLWTVQGLGEGITSLAVAEGRAYTLGYREDGEFVYALDASSGETLWTARIGGQQPSMFSPAFMRWLSPRVPTVDGDRIYAVSANGELSCLRADTGKLVWRKSYVEDFQSQGRNWGYCDYPLVDGENLICVPGGLETKVVALNKRSGDIVWRAILPGSESSHYAAPVISTAGGLRHYVIFLQTNLVGIAAEDGRLLWRYGGTAQALANSYTPIVRDDFVFSANGYGGGMALLKLTPDGASISAVEQYRLKFGFSPFQDNTVLVKDHIYAVEGAGRLVCIDMATGKQVWGAGVGTTQRRASIIYADGHLVVRRSDGSVTLVQATPDEYIEKGTFSIADPEEALGVTSPVVAGGRLYLRDNDRLLCYDVRSDALAKPRPEPKEITVKVSLHLEPFFALWPQWRGPDRSNRSLDTALLKEWPTNGPPLLWTVEGLGEGITSLAISEGRVYTLGYREDGEFVYALHAVSGETLWTERIGERKTNTGFNKFMRWLSSRVPTVDGDRLYAITADGELSCLQSDSGKLVWRKSYPVDFESMGRNWGYCDYPLVDGENLICVPGGLDTKIVALNKHSGEIVWKTMLPGSESSHYAAPVLSTAGGLRHYVIFLQTNLVGVAAEDGRVLWRYNRTARAMANSCTPIVSGDYVFSANGYGGGMALLKLVSEGDSISAVEQYRHGFQFSAFQDSSVLVNDHVFAVDGVNRLVCIEMATGRVAWRTQGGNTQRRPAFMYADGHLVVRRSDGSVTLVPATPEGYSERGSFFIPNPEDSSGVTSPVVAAGRLYLRDNNRLLCYDLREDALSRPRPEPKEVAVRLSPGGQGIGALAAGTPSATAGRLPEAIYVPTPGDVVTIMLKSGALGTNSVLYDLGSGDGRILISAAREYGCQAVGYEIDERLVAEARAQVRSNGLERLVRIEHADLFTADLSAVDVVAVYLPTNLLQRLRPQFEKLKPGARIVSHQFQIPGIPPTRSLDVVSSEDGDRHRVFVWTAPLDSTVGRQRKADPSSTAEEPVR